MMSVEEYNIYYGCKFCKVKFLVKLIKQAGWEIMYSNLNTYLFSRLVEPTCMPTNK